MGKYFLLSAILFISTFCWAESEGVSTPANTTAEKTVLANSIESMSKLKKIGQGMILYANDNDGNYPPALKDLDEYLGVENTLAWAEENVRYLGERLNTTAPADTPIAYDKIMHGSGDSTGTVVLFNDSHVEFVKKKDLGKYNISSQRIMVEVKLLKVEKELLDYFLKIDDSNAQTNILNDEQAEKLLSAVKDSNDSSVIYAPKLLLWNREAGTVSALKNIMYIKGYAPAKDDKSQPEPITETIREGNELYVKPEIINRNGQEQIVLDVNMVSTKVEFVKSERQGMSVELPTVESVYILSKVAIQDGQIIVFAGTKEMESVGNPVVYDGKKRSEVIVLLKAKKVD